MDDHRLQERLVYRLPSEIWSKIFQLIPADERIPCMWTLTCRFPSFALILSRIPHVWMDWIFSSGHKASQPISTSYAIRLWRELRQRGTSIPIDIHASRHLVLLPTIARCLPSECLPFIRSASLYMTLDHYLQSDLSGILATMHGLTGFAMKVYDPSVSSNQTPIPLVASIPNRPIPSCVAALTTLTLSGIFLDKDAISQVRFNSLLDLRLVDLARVPARCPSIFDVLLISPRVSKLIVRASWTHRHIQSVLFSLPDPAALRDWTCRLRVLEVQGERRDAAPFLNAILNHRTSRIYRVRVVLLCHCLQRAVMFEEIPMFVREISTRADVLTIDTTSFSVWSRRTSVNPIDWGVRWQLYDLWRDFWVRAHRWVGVCSIADMQFMRIDCADAGFFC